MLAASARSRAISARLSAGNCWRLSATNHCANGRRACRARPASNSASTPDNDNAAASNSAASRLKALGRLLPYRPQPRAMTASTAAAMAWRFNQGTCAKRQA